jgi:hypothetical protein
MARDGSADGTGDLSTASSGARAKQRRGNSTALQDTEAAMAVDYSTSGDSGGAGVDAPVNREDCR